MNEQPLILVAEQNLHDLELLNSHLRTLNLSCICTKQGARAVTLAQTHQPNLILLDMMLSDLSANQVITNLKHDLKTATIPIIAVTPLTTQTSDAFGNPSGERLLIADFDDYITKPYNFHQLEIVIHHHLNQLYPLHSL